MNISKTFFCSLVIILLPAYSQLPNLNYHSDVQEDISISEFIVGRWRGEYQETTLNSSDVVVYQLEFTEPNVLVYSKISHQSTKYNVVYRYEFLERDRIKIEGRLLDEWKLSKDGEFLTINSVNGLVPNGRYERMSSIEWPIITLFIGILMLGLLIYQSGQMYFSSIKNKTTKVFVFERGEGRNITSIIIRFMNAAIVFGIGMFIARNTWIRPLFLLIRIPWDSLIMIEISILILILAINNIHKDRIDFRIFRMSISTGGLRHYFGILMLGLSVWGICLGILKLAIFLRFGSYLLE